MMERVIKIPLNGHQLIHYSSLIYRLLLRIYFLVLLIGTVFLIQGCSSADEDIPGVPEDSCFHVNVECPEVTGTLKKISERDHRLEVISSGQDIYSELIASLEKRGDDYGVAYLSALHAHNHLLSRKYQEARELAESALGLTENKSSVAWKMTEGLALAVRASVARATEDDCCYVQEWLAERKQYLSLIETQFPQFRGRYT